MKTIISILMLSILLVNCNSSTKKDTPKKVKVIHLSELDKKAKNGSDFIGNCSKKALQNIGIDTKLLKEIYDNYQSQGKLPYKYNDDVKKMYSLLNTNKTIYEKDIYKCRSQFRKKFSNDIKNKAFLSKMQTFINKNAFLVGPKLIQTLNN